MAHDVYFLTDLHGCYELYDAMINWCFEQDDEALVIFGGDANDRGPAGYRIMRELLDNPQVVYLKGNHEDMFVKAAREVLKECRTPEEAFDYLYYGWSPKINLVTRNNGLITLEHWIKDGMSKKFVDRIDRLPLTFTYDNLDFCHAGACFEYFSKVQNAEYYGDPVDEELARELLWNRTLLPLGWETDRIAVFGHTPTDLLRNQGVSKGGKTHYAPVAWRDQDGNYQKFGGWKIDMDSGAVWVNEAYVLNCHTLEIIRFCDNKNDSGDHYIEISKQGKIID